MEQARASGRYRDAGRGEEGLSDQAKISISRSGSLTQQGGALIERVGLDVFVRDPAFLESYPAFLGERAELSGEREGVNIGQDQSGRGGGQLTQPP